MPAFPATHLLKYNWIVGMRVHLMPTPELADTSMEKTPAPDHVDVRESLKLQCPWSAITPSTNVRDAGMYLQRTIYSTITSLSPVLLLFQ